MRQGLTTAAHCAIAHQRGARSVRGRKWLRRCQSRGNCRNVKSQINNEYEFISEFVFGYRATTAFERNVLLVALPFALSFTCAVTLACLCLFPLVERPFMYSNWPQLVWRAVRERRLGVSGGAGRWRRVLARMSCSERRLAATCRQ